MNKLIFLLFLIVAINNNAYAQSKETTMDTKEKEILELSQKKFNWKTGKKYDLLADLFDDELVFIHITGTITTKSEWMNTLRSGSFVYDKIEVKEASAKVYNNIAVLVGKATYTINGGAVFKLIYTEVYALKNGNWKLINLHTTKSNF